MTAENQNSGILPGHLVALTPMCIRMSEAAFSGDALFWMLLLGFVSFFRLLLLYKICFFHILFVSVCVYRLRRKFDWRILFLFSCHLLGKCKIYSQACYQLSMAPTLQVTLLQAFIFVGVNELPGHEAWLLHLIFVLRTTEEKWRYSFFILAHFSLSRKTRENAQPLEDSW